MQCDNIQFPNTKKQSYIQKLYFVLLHISLDVSIFSLWAHVQKYQCWKLKPSSVMIQYEQWVKKTLKLKI